MLEILQNPKTENYLKLKELILDKQFPWYFQDHSTVDSAPEGHSNFTFYSHLLLQRPEDCYYSKSASTETEIGIAVVSEILRFNDTSSKFFITRLCINSNYPIEGEQFSPPHVDHYFPHTNFLCYLTEDHGGGGRTFVEGHPPHEPIEDQCIVFTGKHYLELPKKGRRIVIVGTMACY